MRMIEIKDIESNVKIYKFKYTYCCELSDASFFGHVY